jgi:serine phosphatase RsbU (regulator of sigma subunit)
VQVQIGAAKVAKYATSESGDTLEVIERPQGGLSVVLVDGQRSGRAAKIISNIVARKAVSLLGEGVRDGATARAAHDYLRTHRGGQVSADLQILSVDLASQTVVLSRNAACPAFLAQGGTLQVLDAPSEPIGIHTNTKPVIVEVPLQAATYVLLCTDGLYEASQASGDDLGQALLAAAQTATPAQTLADALLERALVTQQRRPADDTSVVVLAVLAKDDAEHARRLSICFPV